MWPRTKLGEERHRKKKRELEIKLIIDSLYRFIGPNNGAQNKDFHILEFGCGDGFQIPYLKKIGHLIASDIYVNSKIKLMGKDLEFYKCGIIDTPFDNDYFSLIFSNHVIEHIENLEKAFAELKRIGRDNCLYTFSVPTNVWLLLSIPAQYYNKARKLIKSFCSLISRGERYPAEKIIGQNTVINSFLKILHFILPTGHGTRVSFQDCYQAFKISNWKRLFQDSGFEILYIRPLLLYAPSEWPIIPTTSYFAKSGICSSVLFILKKRNNC
jgi:SAM-dependent methyltransferase